MLSRYRGRWSGPRRTRRAPPPRAKIRATSQPLASSETRIDLAPRQVRVVAARERGARRALGRPSVSLVWPVQLSLLLLLAGGPTGFANLNPSAGSIFGSLLGTGSSAGNSAAQQQQLAAAAADQQHQSYKIGQTSDKVTLPGDILLGGLFPIHMKGTKVECGEINRDRGIQRLEAMLYALDRINEDQELLPEIKLGAILLDSCSSSTYALNQSLEFIRASINTVESSAFECKDKSTPRPKYGSKMIAGVIGGSYSEVSLQVANLLRLFRIPQVSYASTGTALSDKTLYDLFARTVPSDMFQARAIADIVLKLNWSYVSLVSSEGLYGDSGSKEFMKQASVRRICIATHEKVSPTTDEGAYDLIVANLLKRNATGVVLFTRAEDTKELLKAVKRAGLFHSFAWVAADGWGTHQKLVEGVEEVAWGAITVELQAKAIPGFDQYMKALTPWGNLRNPWFSEYWQEWFDCQLQANLLQQQQVAAGVAGYSSARRAGPAHADDYGSGEGGGAGPGDDYEPTDGGRKRRRSLPDRKCSTGANHTAPRLPGDCKAARNSTTRVGLPPTERADQPSGGGSSTTKPLVRGRRMAAAAGAQVDANGQRLEPKPKQFCSPNLRISESNSYRQEQKVQFVVDAVYAMAHALHKAWYQLCDARPGVVCEALKELNGGEFYAKYLLNVSFKDLAGSEVKFDEHGDGLGRYNIYNYRQVKPRIGGGLIRNGARQVANDSLLLGSDLSAQAGNLNIDELENSDSLTGKPNELLEGILDTMQPGGGGAPTAVSVSDEEPIITSNDRFEYSAIGRWDENEYHIQLDDIEFIQGDRLIPESYCSRPCELGQAKIMRAGDHCCWICKTCAPYEYLPDEFSCRDCGIGRWPELNKTSCFDLPQKYLRWDSAYSLMSLTIACLGIALTLFVSVIFIKYLDTPVVKASGRELSFILLAGIGFCHLSTFVLLSKPTPFICGSQRFLVNFGFALMYASLLVKTNRISRIFNCARKSAKRPSFISPKSQMLITGILVAIQIFLTIVWFVFEPPGIRADSPEGKRDEVILKCRAKGKSFIISLVYNMILITTCTIYAVKTRKIPENFNESKFIGFTMYTTIVIWLAFVTMFFGTNNSYEIQINTMCVCISLSAYVTLFCLFSPKLSIILLHPDKNVRKLTMNSATYKRPFKPVSSFASVDGRNNTTGTAYNGAQTDAGSGPMSTTSNVLNLAESQAARQQESSIVSNVVNSNSAGSNCSNSQKTPTTLSQQLTLVGACANCGAHQLTQVAQMHSQAGAIAAAGGSSVRSTFGTDAGAGQQLNSRGTAHQHGIQRRNLPAAPAAHHHQDLPQVSMSRSAILVSSSPCPSGASAKQGAGPAKAKVLHSKIMAQQQQQESSTGTPTPVTLKRISSDEHLLTGASGSQLNSPYGQQPLRQQNATAAYECGSAAKRALSLSKNGRHLASLSRLNELATSTTSSDRHYCGVDESISSLANESFANTSQENTPCNVAGYGRGAGGQPGKQANYAGAKLGSDSMLWNQSVYSIDYCSDCCPSSYCHCSCAACSLSNGADEMGHQVVQAEGSNAICLHATTSSHQDTEVEDYDPVLDCSLMVHEIDTSPSSRLDQHQPAAGFLIRRRKSEEPHRGSSCYYYSSGGNQYTAKIHRDHIVAAEQEAVMRVQQASCQRNPADGEGLSSGEPSSKARRSQTMEMRNLGLGTGEQTYTTATSSTCAKPKSKPVDSETGAQQLPEHHQHGKSAKHQPGQKKNPVGSNQPVVYALQAAATSALSGCTATQLVSSLEQSAPANELHQHQRQQQQNIQFTSSKDKNSERHQHRKTSDQGGRPSSQSSTHHVKGKQPIDKQPLNQEPEQVKGAIQASIEMVKSTSRRRSADQRREKRESSCFDYHDDYEYNYGLVQSNSDSENYCCEEDSGGDGGDTRASSIPGDDADGTQVYANYRYRYRVGDDDVMRDDDDADDGHDDGDGEEDEEADDNYDEDFEHDGRVTLNRQRTPQQQQQGRDRYRKRSRKSSVKSRGSRSGSGSSRRPHGSAKDQFQMDEHRINSVALIAATLSAGGAIVESGASSPRQVSGAPRAAPIQPAADKSTPSVAPTALRSDNTVAADDQRQDFGQASGGNKETSNTTSSSSSSGPMEGNQDDGHVSCLTLL